MRSVLRISLVLLLLGACATAQQQGPSEEEQTNARLGGDAVVVLPLQTLSPSATPQLSAELASVRWQPLRDAFSDTLRNAFAVRATGETWVWPAQLRQAHRRNPALVPDASALAVGSLRGMRLEPDTDLPERLAEQLRMLLAISEGRRYFLLPVDLILSHGAGGFTTSGQLLAIDGRRHRVVWARRMTGPAAPTPEAALSAYAGAVATLFMYTEQ